MPPRTELFVVGIGNPLREDDCVGIYLLERLQAHFGAAFPGLIVYEPDIALAERLATCNTLLVIDALATEVATPFRLDPLPAAETIYPRGGYSSHLFDWGMLLAMARDLFGRAPQAYLCGVRARNFGIAEQISAACRVDAEAAFVMLCDYVSEKTGLKGAGDRTGTARAGQDGG